MHTLTAAGPAAADPAAAGPAAAAGSSAVSAAAGPAAAAGVCKCIWGSSKQWCILHKSTLNCSYESLSRTHSLPEVLQVSEWICWFTLTLTSVNLQIHSHTHILIQTSSQTWFCQEVYHSIVHSLGMLSAQVVDGTTVLDRKYTK